MSVRARGAVSAQASPGPATRRRQRAAKSRVLQPVATAPASEPSTRSTREYRNGSAR